MLRNTALTQSPKWTRVLSPQEWELAKPLAPERAPHVYRIDANTVAKSGLDETRAKAEVAAMNLVRERTAIPVPKIYNCYLVEDTQKWCILMEYAEGDVLQDVWEDIPNEWKQSIISQLKGYMEELRNIKGDFIGAVDGTQCEDQFFHQQDDEYGPFDTEAAFHDALADVLRASDQNAFVEMVVGFIKSMPPHNIVLTHSDFAPRNIIVQDDKVVAILDWELTGYYPAYWEYVKAYYRPNWSSDWIKDRVLDDILEPYPLEHAVMLHTRDIIW